MEMKWYAAYTKPNWEKKVIASLNRKKITHFCPLEVLSKQENKKVSQSFNCYVFVKVSEEGFKQLKQINGIKHVLYWMDKPAVVTEPEIELIKSFIAEHSFVKIERETGNGSLYNNATQNENEAKLIHLNNTKIKASLPSLRLILIAEFEKSAVRLASNKNLITYLRPKSKYKLASS